MKVKITIEIDTGDDEDPAFIPPVYPRMIQCAHCGFQRKVTSERHESNVKRGRRGHCDGTWIRDLMGGECFYP